MKNEPQDRPEKQQSFFRKPSDSDINPEPCNSQNQLDFKLNELGDFEDIIQNKSVKGNFHFSASSFGFAGFVDFPIRTGIISNARKQFFKFQNSEWEDSNCIGLTTGAEASRGQREWANLQATIK